MKKPLVSSNKMSWRELDVSPRFDLVAILLCFCFSFSLASLNGMLASKLAPTNSTNSNGVL